MTSEEFVDDFLTELESLFGGEVLPVPSVKPTSTPKYKDFNQDLPESTDTTIKPPIRTAFGNSGDFSPHKATDPRHPQGHQGVDLRASGGTPVFSIAAGIVRSVGYSPKSGNFVTIEHVENLKTFSAHLGTISVQQGQQVTTDTQIGTVGDSGNAKGTFPHIHFQVWKNGALVDPKTIFSIPAYSKPADHESLWLSDKHKQDANNFNINHHLTQRQAAFKGDIKKLAKLLKEYEAYASLAELIK